MIHRGITIVLMLLYVPLRRPNTSSSRWHYTLIADRDRRASFYILLIILYHHSGIQYCRERERAWRECGALRAGAISIIHIESSHQQIRDCILLCVERRWRARRDTRRAARSYSWERAQRHLWVGSPAGKTTVASRRQRSLFTGLFEPASCLLDRFSS